MTLPTAFDEAGIRMLDSVREIFDILGIQFESVGFNFEEYKQFKQLVAAINERKCPVIGVLRSYLNPAFDGAHAMVETGIKSESGGHFIQMKNSYADNPKEQGSVRYKQIVYAKSIADLNTCVFIYSETSSTCHTIKRWKFSILVFNSIFLIHIVSTRWGLLCANYT